jgi:hypothetical protein
MTRVVIGVTTGAKIRGRGELWMVQRHNHFKTTPGRLLVYCDPSGKMMVAGVFDV